MSTDESEASAGQAATCTVQLEELRASIVNVDALANAIELLLRTFPRMDDKEAAIAFRRLWALVDTLTREVHGSIDLSERVIARALNTCVAKPPMISTVGGHRSPAE